MSWFVLVETLYSIFIILNSTSIPGGLGASDHAWVRSVNSTTCIDKSMVKTILIQFIEFSTRPTGVLLSVVVFTRAYSSAGYVALSGFATLARAK